MNRDDKKSERTESNGRIVKPDFDGWGFNLAAESWWNHPLFAKGGPLAIVGVAVWKLADLAHEALNATGMCEGARMSTAIAFGAMIVCLVAIAIWLVRPHGYAKNEEKPKRTAEPRDQSSGS